MALTLFWLGEEVRSGQIMHAVSIGTIILLIGERMTGTGEFHADKAQYLKRHCKLVVPPFYLMFLNSCPLLE